MTNGKRNKHIKSRFLSRLNDCSELPAGLLSDELHIELNAGREMTVQGRCSIIEYSDSVIRLNTRTGILKIEGCGLQISAMEAGNITICGKILTVSFG